jgi:putative MATE family efflux protein
MNADSAQLARAELGDAPAIKFHRWVAGIAESWPTCGPRKMAETVNLTDQPDEFPRKLRLFPDPILAKRLLRLGSWVMAAMITQFMVNAADNLLVGRLPKEVATASQAALGLGMPLFWAVGGFFSAVSFGTQAITARRFAENDDERTGQVLFNSLGVAIFAGLLGTLIGYFASEPFVNYFAEASPEQKQMGLSFVQIRALGIPSMVITFSFKSFFDGIGRTHVHLYAAVVMNIVNLIVAYVLIFGSTSLDIASMGLDGAAWAATISSYAGLAVMAFVSLQPAYNGRFRFYRFVHRDREIMWRIVKLLLPAGSATLILMAGFLLFIKFVGMLDAESGSGNVYSAASKAIMDTAALCFMPLLAFGTATATAVSQCLGAGKPNLAARYAWDAVRMGLIAMAFLALPFILIPHEIIGLWSPNDPMVAEVGAGSLRLIAYSLPMMVVGLILSQALYGAGANTYVMIAEGCLHFGVLVPLSYLLGPYLGYGLDGIYLAAVTYITGLGLAMAIKFLGKGWRNVRL